MKIITLLVIFPLFGSLTANAGNHFWENRAKGVKENRFSSLGAQFVIRTWRPNDAGTEAFKLAEAESDRLTKILDESNPNSEIAKLSATAGEKPVRVSSDLLEVLWVGKRMHKLTGGVFDLTFLPLHLEKTKKGPSTKSFSKAEEIKQGKRGNIGGHKMKVYRKNSMVWLPRRGMKLGVKGLAIGHMVDKIAQKLKAGGWKKFAVYSSGTIAFGAEPPAASQLLCIESPSALQKCGYQIQVARWSDSLFIATTKHLASSDKLYNVKTRGRVRSSDREYIAGRQGAWVQAAATSVALMGPAGFKSVAQKKKLGLLYFEANGSPIGSLAPYAKVISAPPR